MSALDTLDAKYRVILCDVWGVIHDGIALYPGAEARLREWRREGRRVILITNAPRTAEAVSEQLVRIGLPRDCWDGIATSGEAGIEALNALGHPVGFIGTRGDRAVLEGRGVRIAQDETFTDLACTGVTHERPEAEDYRAELDHLAAQNVVLHCLNPDRVVVRGGEIEACAGAIADLYEAMGGKVVWYGKPHETIYSHALHLAGNPEKASVLAIGDGLQTDMLGAATRGFDTIFISGGIHAGEDFPADFAARYGFGDWKPIAVVEGLA
jgi:HAD superfamily hydrolase (TIGR01459 family)